MNDRREFDTVYERIRYHAWEGFWTVGTLIVIFWGLFSLVTWLF